MSTCTGDSDREPWWQNVQHLNAQAMYREQFPDGCEFCGEPADAEMGEWWDEAAGRSKVGHSQCGLDSGLPMA
jgi:hypothetical protein